MNQHLTIELNGSSYVVELIGSDLAERFAALLPFDASVSRTGGHHYWGFIPERLPTPDALKTSEPERGGLYYADHLTAIAVYFGDPGSIAPYVVYKVGEIIDDLSGLRRAPMSLRLRAAPAN